MIKRCIIVLFLSIFSLSIAKNSFAFWVWTPETNKWTNPKYSVKETPAEQLEYAQEFYQAKEYKEAIREYRKLLKHYPRARQAPDAQYFIGRCFENQEQHYGAFKQYQLVIDKYPFSERSAEIVKRQYDIGVKFLEGKTSRSKLMEAISDEDYDVVNVFNAVIKNAPYGDLAGPAQYKIGLYFLEKQLYQDARDEFEKVINDYPDSEWSKAAKYQIAMSDSKRSAGAQYDQKITESAVEEFKEFVEVYPEAELSKEAKTQIQELKEKEAENNVLVARFYEKQKNFKAAKMYYQTIVDEYPSSKWASESLKKIRDLGKQN